MQPKRRGIIPLILGLVLMFVAAPALLFGGAAYGLRGAVDVAREAPVHQPGDSVALTAGEPVFILVDTGAATGDDVTTSEGSGQSCTIAGADGTSLSREGGATNLAVNFEGRHWEAAGSYAVPATGEYAVTCAGPAKVFTGQDAEKLGGKSLLALLGGLFGSLLVGLIGLVLTIVGIVKLVRSGRERRAGGGYGYGGPQGPYGAPVPTSPYGTPPQQQNAYAVPPPPGTPTAPYGSAPPPPYAGGSQPASGGPQPPAYPPPPTGSGSGATAAGGATPYPGQDDSAFPPSTGPATPGAVPPPPPTSDPTYRDPTST